MARTVHGREGGCISFISRQSVELWSWALRFGRRFGDHLRAGSRGVRRLSAYPRSQGAYPRWLNWFVQLRLRVVGSSATPESLASWSRWMLDAKYQRMIGSPPRPCTSTRPGRATAPWCRRLVCGAVDGAQKSRLIILLLFTMARTRSSFQLGYRCGNPTNLWPRSPHSPLGS
jgi:hypothetical protein